MIITAIIMQDSIRQRPVIRLETPKLLDDSVFIRLDQRKDVTTFKTKPAVRSASQSFAVSFPDNDTTSVSLKNKIANVTFYDTTGFIGNGNMFINNMAPFHLVEKNRQWHDKTTSLLIKNLKDGEIVPDNPVHYDWLISIVLISVYLYSLVKATSKNMMPDLIKFFSLRGINDPQSHDMSLLFNWQATILNLISFLIFGLFAFCAAAWYDFLPKGIPDILFWFTCFVFVIAAVTLRHLVSSLVGSLSGKRDLFNEYILNVYKSYRFSSLILFILVILIVYTGVFPPPVYFVTGVILLSIMYLFRVTRLLIGFLKQNISVFYLILYLCSLEILPVLITLKYIAGIV
jgi:hypothetical protein